MLIKYIIKNGKKSMDICGEQKNKTQTPCKTTFTKGTKNYTKQYRGQGR